MYQLWQICVMAFMKLLHRQKTPECVWYASKVQDRFGFANKHLACSQSFGDCAAERLFSTDTWPAKLLHYQQSTSSTSNQSSWYINHNTTLLHDSCVDGTERVLVTLAQETVHPKESTRMSFEVLNTQAECPRDGQTAAKYTIFTDVHLCCLDVTIRFPACPRHRISHCLTLRC